MTGILLLDKPGGITSHDVVTRARRLLGERRIGHAGTLDPMATGLLVLVLGQATRLSSLLTGHDKTYDAAVRLGQATTTDDAEGTPMGEAATGLPADEAVAAALEGFRGTFAQRPPAHSAKKVAGTRAYTLARQDKPVDLAPVDVTVHELTMTGRQGVDVHLRVRASAGFYVRSLARDLGVRLGCGAHLAALRRVRSGAFDVADAWTLAEAEQAGAGAVADRLIAPAEALRDLPAVTVTADGLRRARHGNFLTREHLEGPWPDQADDGGPVRILSDKRLVALARPRGTALHPVVVLG